MVATLLALWSAGLLAGAAILPQEKVAWLFWRLIVFVCMSASFGLLMFTVFDRPLEMHDSPTPAWAWPVLRFSAPIAVVGCAIWLTTLIRSSGKPLGPVSGRLGPIIALAGTLPAAALFAAAAGIFARHQFLSAASAALLLAAGVVGFGTLAAMLGHAYLTAKAMPIEPLRRIVAAYGVAVVLHLIAGTAVCWQYVSALSAGRFDPFRTAVAIMYAVVGLLAPVAFAIMAWQAVSVRNTQSTTGIMYFAMVTNFIGTLALCFLLRGG